MAIVDEARRVKPNSIVQLLLLDEAEGPAT
jgi:hypothetical protein